jgi:hypothetical protein
MRRLSIVVMLVILASVIAPATSSAQQYVNFYAGGFVPRGEDGRSRNDVLWNDLDFLDFRIRDFNGGTAGAEYLVGIGDWLDAGLGVGIYKRTVAAVDRDFRNTNGSDIEADLKLRVIPFTATVRFLPLGRQTPIQPYFGVGVGVLNFRYTETGEFADASDQSVFRGTFVGKGTATGPVILGGVRFPLGQFGVGGEVRYQKAEGDLPFDQEFSGTKIDLGGWTYAATFNIRF